MGSIKKKLSRQRVVLDFEFNRVPRRLRQTLKLKDEILEIGAVKVDENFNVIDKYRQIVKTSYNIVDKQVYKLTDISNKEHESGIDLVEALRDFENWLGISKDTEDNGLCIIYTWSNSDYDQLCKECTRKEIETALLDNHVTKWSDLQRIFDILTEADSNTGLHKAIEYVGIDIQGHEHDATYDSIHTAALANKIKTGEVSKIHKDMQSRILKEKPSISMGGLPLEQRRKLEALLKKLEDNEGNN